MLYLILIALLAFALSLIILAAFQPREFRVTRSIRIDAPAEKIFPHIDTLAAWHAWSPWVRLDPATVNRFEGPPSGVGATTHWIGKKSGAGTMTLTQSRPPGYVEFRLDFKKPMKATNMAEFTLLPEAEHTNLTWSMYGKVNFVGRMMSVFMDCDKMVGRQFENGLANLKHVVETAQSAS